jgi:hypothetical protein
MCCSTLKLGQLQAKIEQEITILNLSAAAADTFFTPLQSKMVFFTQDKIKVANSACFYIELCCIRFLSIKIHT